MEEKNDGLTEKKLALLTGRDFWNSNACKELGIPSVRFSDGPHGLRVQAERASDNLGLEGAMPATCFPTLAALGCSWDAELARGMGERLGEEAAGFGVNVLLGPGVNLKRNPLCGRNFEYLSEDELLAGTLAAEYIRGVQSKGVACCVKHFAVNSREFARTVVSSEVSERALREVYLAPFERAVKAGAGAVMTAYNRVNGVYCSQNEQLITGILRGEWGFDGIVVSDWTGTYDRAAGVRAGEDIEMPSCRFTVDELKKAIAEGRLAEAEADACAERIGRFACRYANTGRRVFDPAEHLAFAREAAKKCAVLLKNEGALPINKGASVAVLGALAERPHIQGGGSSHVNAQVVDDVIHCLSEKFVVTACAEGYRTDGRPSKRLLERALAAAKTAEHVVLFMGLTENDDAEGGDRKDMFLPECQTALLQALAAEGIRPAVVLCAGSAVDTSWDGLCSAVLYLPLTGAGTGGALADLLCGDSVPCGKLAQTFPLRYEDVACAQSYSKDPYICRHKEDIFVGYRWFDAAGLPVKYPFGHGLSYASFEYSRLSATESGVAFRVKNTGGVAATEVAQVYVSQPDSGHAVAVRKLLGFAKVTLAPGEEQAVFVPIDRQALAIYSEEDGGFVTYAGRYGIAVGSSSRDLRLHGEMNVNGAQPLRPGEGAEQRRRIIMQVKSDTPSAPAKERGRITVNMYTPLADLKRARGLCGRLIYRIADMYCTSKKQTALLTFRYLTVRSAMQFAQFNLAQAHGFIDICNGRFFKGLKKIITKREE